MTFPVLIFHFYTVLCLLLSVLVLLLPQTVSYFLSNSADSSFLLAGSSIKHYLLKNNVKKFVTPCIMLLKILNALLKKCANYQFGNKQH